ncbi:MAG TPA: PEGA domain-containing protein [Kofleriaceae bacterium]|nr:PEGA domain-containing protein [Kofleriaceae bacterium]
MIKLALCALALSVVSGCATLFGGGPDYVPVSTNPPGAWVYYNGQPVGQTPTMVLLERGRPAQIQIALAGFQPVVLERQSDINGWFWANFVWFYTFVWIVDFVDGDWRRFDDTPIAIGLTPLAGGPPPPYQQPPPQYAPQPMPPAVPPPQ